MKKILSYSLTVLLVGVIIYILYIRFSAAETGDQAPDFSTELVDGSSFSLSDLKGKHVLLDFWGSWCGPCRREIPELKKLHSTHRDQITIVTIALEKNGEDGKKAALQEGFSWKHQIVEEAPFVMLSPIARKYGISEIPTKFYVSPEGILTEIDSYNEVISLLRD